VAQHPPYSGLGRCVVEVSRLHRQTTLGRRVSYGYLLTPWSRVLLEKLTGFASSQEIPRIYVLVMVTKQNNIILNNVVIAETGKTL
jgi:hypothetical protein